MRALLIALSLTLAACRHEPPLPPELPSVDPALMRPVKPLPALPERPADVVAVYRNNADVRGVCVPDRRRLTDLQAYVRGLTK